MHTVPERSSLARWLAAGLGAVAAVGLLLLRLRPDVALRLVSPLKAEIDEELIEAYRGTVSLPFDAGDHRRVAVKIVDDRGIESLKIVEIE